MISAHTWAGKSRQVRTWTVGPRPLCHSTTLGHSNPLFQTPNPSKNAFPDRNPFDKHSPRRDIVGTDGPAHCQQLIKSKLRRACVEFPAQDRRISTGSINWSLNPEFECLWVSVYIAPNGRRLIQMTQIAITCLGVLHIIQWKECRKALLSPVHT